MSSTHERPAQQPQITRKPAFADWPTIKILTLPRGRYSPQTDEWCATYCTQSVTGRFHGQQPACRSICIRKVFLHEVQNIVSFKRHSNVGPDGKAKYPLPSEGQSSNIPRMLGGKPSEDPDEAPAKKIQKVKTWEEGWYFWTSNSHFAALEKLDTMRSDLQTQQLRTQHKQRRKEVWQEYQEYLERRTGSGLINQPPGEGETDKFYGPIVPLQPLPDVSSESLLVTLPPEFPVLERINKLLAPSHHAISIMQENIKAGNFQKFAMRVWEKAWTEEPRILARRTCSKAYELWKEVQDSADGDDGKKNSP